MNDIILNNGQQIIYNAAIDWFYNSSSRLFQIASEAGCGKSVLIAAALTYVASVASALIQIFRLVLVYGRREKK